MMPDYDVTTFETWRLKGEEDLPLHRSFLNTVVQRPPSVSFASKWPRSI